MSLSSRRHLALLALALGSPWLSGCGDNISCVFTTGCVGGGGGGGALGAAAVAPENGTWIRDARPTVSDILPDGTDLPGTTPVVIVFSESMNPDTLAGAFQIAPLLGGSTGTPVAGVQEVLVGDGRMLLLLPPMLSPADYVVQPTPAAEPTDVTGQVLESSGGVGSFTVVATPAAAPAVIATWPRDAATNESDTSEIVTVFDRRVQASTVGDMSFQVTVGGAPPADDPPPVPVTVQGVPDTRAYRYRSQDQSGRFTRLGTNADVQVTLSPATSRILAMGGTDFLPTTVFSFTTLPFATPLSSSLLSQPNDAIGVPNLTAGNPEELLVQVDLADGEPNDFLDLFLVGTAKTGMPPQLVAFRRSIELQGTAPILTAMYTLSDVDLLTSSNPSDTRFADGPVSFAFRLRRGSVVSPLGVLDVEPVTASIEDPVLDTTPPVISELSLPGGTTDTYFSDVRDLVLVGRADGPLRSVEVTTAMGNNGVLAPVVGSTDAGLFVTAPVPIGIVPGGSIDFSLVAYDAAFNASPPISGTFVQRGAVGPGAFTPGDPVTIEVFDAETLEPIQGADVYLHADMGDGVNFPFVQAGTTPADGRVMLLSQGAPAVGAIVTVDLAGYDLFTFHGITSTELSIPLMPIGSSDTGLVQGVVSSTNPLAEIFLPFLTAKLDDSRRVLEVPRTYAAQMCMGTGPVLCPYGPEPVRPSRLGVQSFLAGDFLLDEAGFRATDLLQAFCLSIPLNRFASPTQNSSFELPFLLTDPAIEPEEIPIELPQVTFRTDATTGIDTMNLVDDPTTTGVPRVTVETDVPGIPGSVVVGLGLAFSQGPDMWTVRSAIPGAVDAAGFFGMKGAVDTDFLLRCELRDAAGRVSGARPRISELGNLFVPDNLFATSPSVLTSPTPGGNSGGPSYDLVFDDVIPDAAGEAGFYRVEVIGPQVRRWTVWAVDPPGTGSLSLRLPDIAAQGGVPLVDGMIECQIAAFAWPALDPASFLWSDIEREHDLFSLSETFGYDQP